jgi:hypothetical protein
MDHLIIHRPSAKVFDNGSALAIEPMSHPANVFATDVSSIEIPAAEF